MCGWVEGTPPCDTLPGKLPKAVHVSLMSLLEGVLIQADVVVRASIGGYCSVVYKLVSQALPI